jgi:DNA-binding NtrC family response regulator
MSIFHFGTTPSMKDLERRLALISRSGDPVLIQGECGSGKQALAEQLHRMSASRGGFVRIVCGFSSSGWMEAQTAADTLFLKHVHLLASHQQERLLLAFDQVFGKSPRLLSSGSDMLEKLTAKGEFLPELFYRISVHRLYVPPLRERTADIPDLFVFMLREMQRETGIDLAPPPQPVLDALVRYPWPGNARELQNLARTYLLAQNAEELIFELARRATRLSGGLERQDEPGIALKEQVRRAARRLESELILRSLERHGWNRRRTAETLKISYRSLLYKMKDCNIRANAKAGPEGGER